MMTRTHPVSYGVTIAEAKRERAIVAENVAREAQIIADIAPGPMELSVPGIRSHIVVIVRPDGTRDALICDKYLTLGEFEEMLDNLTKRGWSYAPNHSWHVDRRGNRDGIVIHDVRQSA